ncbi:hypothetical protein BCAH1134_2662 [Bacillus cereus AH1134]|nr:hypothetical protein BCAH1134_2662 [Bacillus cereus AH1134]
MNNQNNNETNKINRLLAISLVLSSLLIPILVPSVIIIGMKQLMPNEIEYPRLMSLLTLNVDFS